MPARLAALTLLVASFGAGCAYNPGSFPWFLPPGRVEQTHAKPRLGYFHDFDRKAQKLVVQPGGIATAPLGSQIVIVASVLDKDGQPRRSRRVEWMIEGPGNIVEADESGMYAGRGYKVDNKYAVTLTGYVPHTITRGNDDPADDVAVESGQTFIVLTSAVPGETVVTAYAPEVYNRENGLVVTKVMWGDGRFSFPASTSARVGTEVTLATGINPSAIEGTGQVRVRYRVIEGPPVNIVTSNGTTTSYSGAGSKETELPADNGEATVRIVQTDPKAGKTRVAVEVVRLPDSGVGPGTVVGRRETTVEWGTPSVKLNVAAPPVASAGADVPVTVSLDNVSAVDSKDARIRVTLSDGATLARSEPPPVRVDEQGGLIFDLPPVPAKGKQQVALQVKPARVGPVTVSAEAVTGDGVRASTNATTRVEKGKLQLLVEVPPTALAGERIPARVAVTNTGAAAVENVTVWASFDPGLSSERGPSPVELSGGALAPGQTKTFDLPLSAKATGRYAVRASATGDGNLSASADPVSVAVRRAELAVAVTGPKLAYIFQQAEWSVTVANRGDAPVANVAVRAAVPAELKVTAAEGAAVSGGAIEWKLAELKAGETKTFAFTTDATRLSPQASVTVAATGEAQSNGMVVGAPVEGKAEAAVAIIGTPALGLEVVAPPGPLEAGKRIRYQIRVKNHGTVAAQKLEVLAFASPELRVVGGSADGGAVARTDAAGGVAFPVVEELQPGQSATFTVEVDAARSGDARFRAEVRAAHLKGPLKEEQATRITGK